MVVKRILTALLVAIFLAGCAPQDKFEILSKPAIGPEDTIPNPTGAIVLEISGAINNTNQGDHLLLDMEMLESMGLIQYSVDDPWFNTHSQFTGVRLSDLLDIVDISPDASILHFIALDDYEVFIPVEDAYKWPIMLVTRTNGDYMDVANAGPTRIVYPHERYVDINIIETRDLWIWNIKNLEIK